MSSSQDDAKTAEGASTPLERDVYALAKALTDPAQPVRRDAALRFVPLWDGLTADELEADPTLANELAAVLDDPDQRVGWAAARLLLKVCGKAGRNLLASSLRDGNAEARHMALLALKGSRDSNAVAALREAAGDPDPQMRKDAARALPLPHDADSALALLVVAEKHPEDAEWLGELLAKSATPRIAELEAALTSAHTSVRVVAAGALGGVEGERRQQAAALLSSRITDRDVRVRRAVVQSLVQVGTDPAFGALASALDDEDGPVRDVAARGLARIVSLDHLEAVAATLRSGSVGTRRAAATALVGAIGRSRERTPTLQRVPPFLESALRQATSDEDSEVRRLCVSALSATLENLQAVVRCTTDPVSDVRRAAVEALGRFSPELPGVTVAAAEALANTLEEDHGSVRVVAAQNLARMVPLDHLEAVAGTLVSGTAGSRRAAATALVNAVRWSPQQAATIPSLIESALRQATSDEDFEVRRLCVSVLPATPANMQAVVRCTTDQVSSVREAAVEALGRFSPALPEVILAAVRAAQDSSEQVWTRAIQILRQRSGSFSPAAVSVVNQTWIALLGYPDWRRRLAAADAITLTLTTDVVVNALASVLCDQSSPVAYAAALKLAKSQNTDAHQILLMALKHPDRDVSAAAAYGIRNASNAAFVPLLVDATSDMTARVRCDAVRLLDHLDRRAARRASIRLQHDGIAKVRTTAKQVLKRSSGKRRWQSDLSYEDYITVEIESALTRLDSRLQPEADQMVAFRAVDSSYRDLSEDADISRYPRELRYLNTWLTDWGSDIPALPSKPLLLDHIYKLTCQIGPPSPLSAVVKGQDHPFPDLSKDSGAVEVELVIVGYDFTVLDPSRATVTIPSHGSSKTAEIRVRTPNRRGSTNLRILAMYRGNCVMSQFLQAAVGDGGGYTVIIDYVLTADMAQLPALIPQDLSLHTAMGDAGEIRLVVGGGLQDMFSTSLNDGRVRNAAGVARNALLDVHFDPKGNRSRYDDRNSCKPKQCYEDLALLATRGWMLYQNVIEDPARRREFRDVLRRISLTVGRPARLQIVTAGGRVAPFPWQLVYDIPVTGHPPSFTNCPTLNNWLSGESQAIPASCSYKHDRNVLCPFGFWGYAYELASPPSVYGQDRAIFVKRQSGALKAIAAISERLNAAVTRDHFDRLGLNFRQLRSVHDLEDQLLYDHPDLVYFYCHGKREDMPGGYPRPLLEIGSDELIAPEDIAAWSENWPNGAWRDPRPLVFMNGCHTSELTPDLLTDFITTFGEVNAAGSIGTEVALTQLVASEAAEQIITAFNGLDNVAAAVRAMRWNLLRKGNTMGLSYTPYCYGGLTLKGPAISQKGKQ
jgi:HEAT repeat protein